MTNTKQNFRVIAATLLTNVDDPCAVIVATGRASFRMTIAEARELSLELQRAADEAEMKLPQERK